MAARPPGPTTDHSSTLSAPFRGLLANSPRTCSTNGGAFVSNIAKRLGRTLALGTVMLWAAQARATASLYTSNCASCHATSSTTPSTCNGCHFHGEHTSTAANDINLKGTTAKSSYAPGETVKVTINGGYRTGWVRALLFDQNTK